MDFKYTGKVQTTVLKPGTYKLECWGAQGSGKDNYFHSQMGYGGHGGYSVGILSLTESKPIFVYVGGMGQAGNSANTRMDGGFNGGGSAFSQNEDDPGAGGGGGTDIRIGVDSLHARVIVAGGGGGGGEDNDVGGVGGGLSGGCAKYSEGSPGMQTLYNSKYTGGVFGYGAHTMHNGGGAGGGWYGANAWEGSQTKSETINVNDNNGGCGGSGYVYTSETASYYPNCLLNPSYYLENATTVAGDKNIFEPDGSTSIGHFGAGFARITPIKIYPNNSHRMLCKFINIVNISALYVYVDCS